MQAAAAWAARRARSSWNRIVASPIASLPRAPGATAARRSTTLDRAADRDARGHALGRAQHERTFVAREQQVLARQTIDRQRHRAAQRLAERDGAREHALFDQLAGDHDSDPQTSHGSFNAWKVAYGSRWTSACQRIYVCHCGRSLDPICARSRTRPSTSFASSRPSASGRACCSRAARTRSSCSGSPRRRSGRRGFRSRSCTSTPATTSPRRSTYRDRRVAELGERLIVANVQDSIDHGSRHRGDRAARVAQPAADHDAARRDRGAPVRRRDRRRAPRRGARAREGADLLASRRVRPVGSEEPAARAVVALQRTRASAASTCACSRCRTGPSSTSGSTSGSRRSRCRRSTSRTTARCSSATACCTRRTRS